MTRKFAAVPIRRQKERIKKGKLMKIRTKINSRALTSNHNQTLVKERIRREIKQMLTNITNNKVHSLLAIAGLLVLCFAISPRFITLVSAQTPPLMTLDIYQNGVKVGEVFRPAGTKEEINYVEHWVLFDNFVYMGAISSMSTSFVKSHQEYSSEQDFFARVPWGKGFRYVRVDCNDTTSLPGR